MQITIISGSTRDNAQSLNVAHCLQQYLSKKDVTSPILDLNKNRLPIYDATDNGPWEETWNSMSKMLAQSDGYIFVSPEWDGMWSVGLHNMLLYADKELADKPVLAVGVSSGQGGRYPLQNIRSMGYKNKRFVVIPESIFYDHVEETLKNGVLTNSRIAERTEYAIEVLVEYAKALTLVRNSGTINYEKYPNGL